MVKVVQHLCLDKVVEPSIICCLNGDQDRNREKPGGNEFQRAVTLQWLRCRSSPVLQAHAAQCAWEAAKHKPEQNKAARSPPGRFSLVSPAKMLTWMSFRINISRVICTQCCSVYLLITDLYTLSIIIECQDERQPKGLNAMFCHKENTAKVMAGSESRDTLGWKEIGAQYRGFFCRVLGFCFKKPLRMVLPGQWHLKPGFGCTWRMCV